MPIRRIDYPVYEGDGRRRKNESVNAPSWTKIEELIRRLDQFHYPWVLLRLTDDESDDDYMTVMGGKGAYWLGVSTKGYDQRHLRYPGKGKSEVEVWTSDQGYSCEEREVCSDVETALRAARYFAEHADCDPSLPWEEIDRSPG